MLEGQKLNHKELTQKEFKTLFDSMFPEGLKKPRNVLDAGCRDESSRIFFQELGLVWVGIDLKGGEGILKGDMSDMPFPDNCFNFIYCSHAFEHCERPIDALREFRRVLLNAGILFLSTPYPTENQIMNIDKQHIFCLSQLQIHKLLLYCGGYMVITSKIVKGDEKDEDTWSVITIVRVV